MTKKYIFSFSKFFIILALILNANIFTEANSKLGKNTMKIKNRKKNITSGE